MSGRWFRGGYDEFGIDITARRLGSGATVDGVLPKALARGTRDVEVTVFGANLSKTAALDFGLGVRVTRVVRASADEIVARVSVDSLRRAWVVVTCLSAAPHSRMRSSRTTVSTAYACSPTHTWRVSVAYAFQAVRAL